MDIPRTQLLAVTAMLLTGFLPLNPVNLEAQSAAGTPAGGEKRDPFVKDPTPPPAGDPAPIKLANLRFTFEVYAMAQDDAAHVLELSGSGTARHDAVLALMKAGKARLETLMCCVTKPGQRAVVESVDEVRYAVGWAADPYSPDVETRNAGDTIEIEPTLSDDEKLCNLNIVPQRVHLAGFPFVPGNILKSPVDAQPVFRTNKFTTCMDLFPGEPDFMGTMSNPPQFEEGTSNGTGEETRLAFGRVDVADMGYVNSQPQARPFTPDIELELTFYSLDREAAREILSDGYKGEECYKAVKALAGRQQAKLERVAVLKTKSGQRAVVYEVNEVRFPTHYDAAAPARKEVSTSAFQTRDTGLTFEIEATVGGDGKLIDINMVPQLVSYEGDLQTAPGSGAQVEPQPLFETRKVTTSMTTMVGQHALIGTYNHPDDDGVNGRKDSGQVWFGFVKGTF